MLERTRSDGDTERGSLSMVANYSCCLPNAAYRSEGELKPFMQIGKVEYLNVGEISIWLKDGASLWWNGQGEAKSSHFSSRHCFDLIPTVWKTWKTRSRWVVSIDWFLWMMGPQFCDVSINCTQYSSNFEAQNGIDFTLLYQTFLIIVGSMAGNFHCLEVIMSNSYHCVSGWIKTGSFSLIMFLGEKRSWMWFANLCGIMRSLFPVSLPLFLLHVLLYVPRDHHGNHQFASNVGCINCLTTSLYSVKGQLCEAMRKSTVSPKLEWRGRNG